MTDLIGLVGIGITAFIASNIDDTFILILLFMTPGLSARNVTIGQFLGIIILVTISSLAVLLSLAIPRFVLGFLGIIPAVIGIKRLSEYRENKLEANKQSKHLSILSVITITVSNGGDDIGVFTPLFANYNNIIEFSILVLLLMVMTGIWCVATYYFFRHPFISSHINSVSKILSPLVLISIGVYILLDSVFI